MISKRNQQQDNKCKYKFCLLAIALLLGLFNTPASVNTTRPFAPASVIELPFVSNNPASCTIGYKGAQLMQNSVVSYVITSNEIAMADRVNHSQSCVIFDACALKFNSFKATLLFPTRYQQLTSVIG